MDPLTLLLLVIGLAAGAAGGFGYASKKLQSQAEDHAAHGRRIVEEAEKHARELEKRAHSEAEKSHQLLDEARKEAESARAKAEKIVADAKAEEKEIRTKLEAVEKRLDEKEKAVDAKLDGLEKRRLEVEAHATEIGKAQAAAEQYRDQQKAKLEEVAGLSRDEAKAELINQIEKDSAEELVKKIKISEEKANDEADKRAGKIISQAVQRISHDVTTESTVTLVTIPSDDVKGQIIGREGRNITAFELATGVDVIVDDTPNAVIISGFDLVRRFVAKTALEKLISDGRIQPARIEEAVQKAQKEVDEIIKDSGEKAVIEAGVAGLPPQIVKLLGRLRFRTSYGQNNLKHSLEVCWLGAALAAEIPGADIKLAKAACLLHDLGKAVDHEIEGSHAVIGADILRKFNIDPRIIHAVEAHHNDIEPTSIEDFIVMAADAISGGRPGARRDSLENYIQRLTELENIAKSFTGVANAFAIQAGREVRVLVNPESIDDLGAVKLSKEIATKIEGEMAYPGQIKVNVIRETRAVDYAK